MKYLTLDQADRKRLKAVQFLEDVVGDPSRAADFDAMSPEEYAEHKGIEIIDNPRSQTTMTKQELEQENAELKQELKDFQDEMDTIVEIASGDGEEDDDDEEDEEDDEGEA